MKRSLKLFSAALSLILAVDAAFAAPPQPQKTVFLNTGQFNLQNTKVLNYRVSNPIKSSASFNRIAIEERAKLLSLEPPTWMSPDQIGPGGIIDTDQDISDAFRGYEDIRIEGVGQDGLVTLFSAVYPPTGEVDAIRFEDLSTYAQLRISRTGADLDQTLKAQLYAHTELSFLPKAMLLQVGFMAGDLFKLAGVAGEGIVAAIPSDRFQKLIFGRAGQGAQSRSWVLLLARSGKQLVIETLIDRLNDVRSLSNGQMPAPGIVQTRFKLFTEIAGGAISAGVSNVGPYITKTVQSNNRMEQAMLIDNALLIVQAAAEVRLGQALNELRLGVKAAGTVASENLSALGESMRGMMPPPPALATAGGGVIVQPVVRVFAAKTGVGSGVLIPSGRAFGSAVGAGNLVSRPLQMSSERSKGGTGEPSPDEPTDLDEAPVLHGKGGSQPRPVNFTSWHARLSRDITGARVEARNTISKLEGVLNKSEIERGRLSLAEILSDSQKGIDSARKLKSPIVILRRECHALDAEYRALHSLEMQLRLRAQQNPEFVSLFQKIKTQLAFRSVPLRHAADLMLRAKKAVRADELQPILETVRGFKTPLEEIRVLIAEQVALSGAKAPDLAEFNQAISKIRDMDKLSRISNALRSKISPEKVLTMSRAKGWIE